MFMFRVNFKIVYSPTSSDGIHSCMTSHGIVFTNRIKKKNQEDEESVSEIFDWILASAVAAATAAALAVVYKHYPVWAVDCDMRFIACHMATGFRNDVII